MNQLLESGGVILLSAYSTEPRWSKIAHRVLYILRYGLVAVIGVLALTEEPDIYLDAVGWVLILTGLMAVFGAISGHYRFEWVALPPMISALLIAGILVATSAAPVIVCLVFVLALSLGVRLLFLTNLASRLRKLPSSKA